MNPFVLFALTNSDAELAAFGGRGENAPVHLREDCCVRGAAAEWVADSAHVACAIVDLGSNHVAAFAKALRLVQAVQRANGHEDAALERLCRDWASLTDKQRMAWVEIAELSPIPEPRDGTWGEQIKYCEADPVVFERDPIVAKMAVIGFASTTTGRKTW